MAALPPVVIPPSRFDLGHLFGLGLVGLGGLFLVVEWPSHTAFPEFRAMTGQIVPTLAVVGAFLVLAGLAALIYAPFAQARIIADEAGLTIAVEKGLPLLPRQTIPWSALSEITVDRRAPRVTTLTFHRSDNGKVWTMNAAGLAARPEEVISAITPFLSEIGKTTTIQVGMLKDRYVFVDA